MTSTAHPTSSSSTQGAAIDPSSPGAVPEANPLRHHRLPPLMTEGLVGPQRARSQSVSAQVIRQPWSPQLSQGRPVVSSPTAVSSPRIGVNGGSRGDSTARNDIAIPEEDEFGSGVPMSVEPEGIPLRQQSVYTAASPVSATSPSGIRRRAYTVSVSLPSSGHKSRRTGDGSFSPPKVGNRNSFDNQGIAEEGHAGLADAVTQSFDHHGENTSHDRRHRRHSEAISVSLSDVDYNATDERGELHDDVVGLLDCVDPEVSAVNHLQNMSNTLMFPNIPSLWSRRPNITLPSTPSDDSLTSYRDAKGARASSESGRRLPSGAVARLVDENSQRRRSVTQSLSAQADLSANGIQVTSSNGDMQLRKLVDDGMTKRLTDETDEVRNNDELDRHVKHVLTKKDRAKRMLRGLWAYLKTPMGVVTAIYGFLVVFWGAAIVLFLLGWIPTSSKNTQDVWVEISSQVENGLFTVTGVGLIPWRAIDTYRMGIIHTLKMRSIRLRKKRGLPPIEDPDDMPDPKLLGDHYESVLTEKDQRQLEYQQEKFAQSQTWYRPHATATHRAFPITLALWNTILMDLNSFFQCILCGCMWGMNRHKRPAWTTGTLIPLSFLCGIGAAVCIWQGGVRTKKTKAVEAKLREALDLPEEEKSEHTRRGSMRKRRPRRTTVSGGEHNATTKMCDTDGHSAATSDPETSQGDSSDLRGVGNTRRATIDVLPTATGEPSRRFLGYVEESSESEDDSHKSSGKVEGQDVPFVAELISESRK